MAIGKKTQFFIDDFLSEQYSWSYRTKETVRRHLTYWKNKLNGRRLKSVTVAEFEHWWRVEKGWSDSMAYNSLWSIKSYMKWFGIKRHKLFKHFVKRKEPPLQPYITEDEAKELIDACDTSTPKGLQDATVVCFMWETWARADSTIKTKVENINLKHKEVTFKIKGGDWQTAAFGDDLKEYLEKWIVVRATIARPNTKSLFINIRRGTPLSYWGLLEILKNLGEKTGIYKACHAFRRGAARQHASEGGSDRAGLAQGRWKTYAMYIRYTRDLALDHFKRKRWLK